MQACNMGACDAEYACCAKHARVGSGWRAGASRTGHPTTAACTFILVFDVCKQRLIHVAIRNMLIQRVRGQAFTRQPVVPHRRRKVGVASAQLVAPRHAALPADAAGQPVLRRAEQPLAHLRALHLRRRSGRSSSAPAPAQLRWRRAAGALPMLPAPLGCTAVR